MNVRWISLVAVMLLVAVPVVPAKAATVRLPYEGSAPLTFQGLSECEGHPLVPAGVVCLDVPRDARQVEFALRDVSGLPVGGTWFAYDATGKYLGTGNYCGAGSAPAPRDGTLVVRIDTINGPVACLDQGGHSAAVATRGIVEFTMQ